MRCRRPNAAEAPNRTLAARPTLLLAALSVALLNNGVLAAEVRDAQTLFRTGKYNECVDQCRAAIEAGDDVEGWWLLKIRAELASGRYADALKTYEAAITQRPRSIQIRLLGRSVLQWNGRPDEAARVPATIVELVTDVPWRYGGAADRATLGRALLLNREDARRVLEQIYDRAKKAEPDAAEPYLASGDLALEKNDFALAAEAFEAAAQRTPDDPDVYFGLARAYQDDSARATAALKKALELNPHHVDSLLFQADNRIDQEAYDEARVTLKAVAEINPRDSRAASYRAVLAHLVGDAAGEKTAREEALAPWRTNPHVDHLIGLKLSQKYRFAEGKTYQQRALATDPNYAPAKVQLCQDLLRLGEEDHGWQLAGEVFKEDPFNILAFNLTTLRDHLAGFRMMQGPNVKIRMDPREADIYGPRVMDLLVRARRKLVEKYAVDVLDEVVVEIFPQQKDFAIRTFGLPGGAGYLGVCFGNVITVNSPASRVATPSNWEAVLWHEFCHSVTLGKTRNRMPRWLSEGISVYEETLENPIWGQTMNPQYREMILRGDATPVSKLSGAFLRPPGPMELQFAYYESSMVVRYIVDRFGITAVRNVLKDLGDSVAINDALSLHTVPIEKLDTDFDAWLRAEAQRLASDADLSREDLPLDGDSATLAAWNRQRPKNVWGLLAEGQALLAERKWQAALAPLQQAAALYPTYAEIGGPYVLMAEAYRELKDPANERLMLQKHASLSADAVAPRLRLLELAASDGDWTTVKKVAEDVLAINPLTAAPHRFLAKAAEALKDRPVAIDARRALLLMDPLDRSGQHYHLAKLLSEQQQFGEAKQQVLRSLEETPRYRDAHRLLLDIVARTTPTTGPSKPKPVAAQKEAGTP
ncbi:MAG TPA: tetratricopeptide repeat protein [Tepidisphaeraceae bacterium]|jgi:tetratricopeptide (TPR) repeat protein